jgi:hypothetical protein
MEEGFRNQSPDFFLAYVEAIVAYREIMRQTLTKLLQEYGHELKRRLGVNSLAALLDVHDPRFLTHRQAAQFAARNRSKNSAKIIDSMHKQLKTNVALDAFSDALRDAGEHALANDLPFFIEYRLRVARTFASAQVQAEARAENVIGFQAHA